MTQPFEYKAAALNDSINEELNAWQKENKVKLLWAGDASLWTNSDENQWVGWLTIAGKELNEVSHIEALADELKVKGYENILVLGMGGSSLCPAMLAETFGKVGNFPRLHVLDSTDPMQIHHLEEALDLTKTFFIVSSKSGSTLEPNIFKQYFYTRLQTLLGKVEVSEHFLAITDPGTTLDTMAKEEQFKAIFHGEPSIGGRYSALSNFGMLPAGLMGIPVKNFLGFAEKMAESCSPAILPKDNPGVLLGAILGISAKQGKDKVTLITSPGIKALGAWLEQLLAESTGKNGKGLIPIDNEPLGPPDVYGNDRIFIYIRLEDAPNAEQDAAVAALEQARQVVVRLKLPSKDQLAAELFRWEIATAVAGSIIGINPFNQPDVEGNKQLAAKLIDEYTKNPLSQHREGSSIPLRTQGSSQKELTAHLNRIQLNDYVNFSAFIEMNDAHSKLLQKSRVLIRNAKKVATCVGFGPRFLHSTGQDYKGGPNTGVFIQITADHPEDIQIPGYDYSFGLVIDAQAEADFETLRARGRRVMRVHLGNDIERGLQHLNKMIEEILSVKNGENHGSK